MRSSIVLTSALAATALAKPVAKRDAVVTELEVVYTTAFVTVTAGQAPASPSPAAPAPQSAGNGHRKPHHSHPAKQPTQAPAAPAAATTTTVVVAPSSSPAPAPAPEAPSSQAPQNPPAQTNTAPAAAQPSASAPGGIASTYQQAVVDHHNYHRANHSAPNIEWSDKLAGYAQQIAQSCVYEHNTDVGKTDTFSYGQNIAAGNPASMIASIISDQFYNGEVSSFTQYGAANPDMTTFHEWGHMSQVVWKGTTQVGCASWTCGSLAKAPGVNPVFTVCNYYPPGNYGGQYGDNIGAPKGQPTVKGSDYVNTQAIGSSYAGSTGQSYQ